ADPVRIASVKGFVAGTINTTLALSLGEWHTTRLVWGALALGFVRYGLGLVLFIRGVRGLGGAPAGNYFSVSPFVGAFAGVLIWQEPLSLGLLTAAFLMAIGVWLHLTERHEHFHVHEPMTHEHEHTHDAHHQHEHAPNDQIGEPHTHPHRHNR